MARIQYSWPFLNSPKTQTMSTANVNERTSDPDWREELEDMPIETSNESESDSESTENRDDISAVEENPKENIRISKKGQDGWEISNNRELLELYYKEPDIIKVVKGQKLRWLGHAKRMSKDRVPKQILESSIGEERVEAGQRQDGKVK
ncbi:hypothetical protein ILUMI_03746 [Ignelater luminosus]|uniref:Uncharacterized protein n=1 Tax=Ignelater luminosus TaxID=2038154 RepID=A0A8K0GJN0_IGNLU|nr:hypothetical protein ILUMI_03746 [Ignelater luminosus]